MKGCSAGLSLREGGQSLLPYSREPSADYEHYYLRCSGTVPRSSCLFLSNIADPLSVIYIGTDVAAPGVGFLQCSHALFVGRL